MCLVVPTIMKAKNVIFWLQTPTPELQNLRKRQKIMKMQQKWLKQQAEDVGGKVGTKSVFTKKKFWKNHPRGKNWKNIFSFFWCFLVDFTKISKNFKIYFFPGGIFRFFSSRLVFPEFFFSINAFLVQKNSFFKILRNRPDKKKIREIDQKNNKKKRKCFFNFFLADGFSRIFF